MVLNIIILVTSICIAFVAGCLLMRWLQNRAVHGVVKIYVPESDSENVTYHFSVTDVDGLFYKDQVVFKVVRYKTDAPK